MPNLAKRLVKYFECFKKFDSFSIKNSIELLKKLEIVTLEEGEILVSFDITSYFPSVPVDDTLVELQTWLNK